MRKYKRLIILLSIFILLSSIYLYYRKNIAINAYKNENFDLTSIGHVASTIPKKQVTIKIGDVKLNTYTMFNTVRECLESLNIEVDENDKVSPSLFEIIDDNVEIEVTKVEIKKVTENINIPFKVITKINHNLDIGQQKIARNGKEGIKEVVKEITYENNIIVSENILNEKVILEPVNKIIEKGTKDYFISSRGTTYYKKSLTMVATAYDLSYESTGKKPGDKYYGITASGTKVRPGVVAVDPKIIPLGTEIFIQGYGFFVAEDTGGAIKGNRIDIFMEDRKKALEFGRKKVKVYILR